MKAVFGDREMEIEELRSSYADELDDEVLRQRLEEDGYLLARELIPRQTVLQARQAIIDYLETEGQAPFAPGTNPMDAVYNAQGRTPRTLGTKAITHRPETLAVFESQELFQLFARLFDEPARTFDYKWLRTVAPGRATGPHYDVVYMGRGSLRLHTCWIPMGDVTPDMGSLAVLTGSHSLPSFQRLRETYGRSDVDRDRTPGHIDRDPLAVSAKFGGEWKTAAFSTGDVLVFGMFTMHASTKNVSDRWRISCDIRYQPESEPIDERWVGESPVAHTSRIAQPEVTMEEARERWGV